MSNTGAPEGWTEKWSEKKEKYYYVNKATGEKSWSYPSVEGGKERIQMFQGIVLAKSGSGLNSAFTVRKISYGTGVERVYCVHSPRIDKVEVISRGKVRRAKLHYLRDRVGKRAIQVKSAD